MNGTVTDDAQTSFAKAVVSRLVQGKGCDDGVHMRIQAYACWGERDRCDAQCDGCDLECLRLGRCSYCSVYLECPDCEYREHGFEWYTHDGMAMIDERLHRLQLGEGHDGWAGGMMPGGCNSPECAERQIPILVTPDSPAFAIGA